MIFGHTGDEELHLHPLVLSQQRFYLRFVSRKADDLGDQYTAMTYITAFGIRLSLAVIGSDGI